MGSKLQDWMAAKKSQEAIQRAAGQQVWPNHLILNQVRRRKGRCHNPRAFHYLSLSSEQPWEAAVMRTTLWMDGEAEAQRG